MNAPFLPACLALVTLLGAGPAFAQELRGSIVGAVTDQTGAPLPGVAVAADSASLIAPRTTMSGADGSYRLPALPPGWYDLTYSRQGFRSLRRERVRVGLNVAVTIDVRLVVAAADETITISGRSPTVDLTSTAVGTSFSDPLLHEIPNARDIWAVIAQAPGFHMTGYDVGGSHAGTQTGYITYGIGGQHKTLLEGINVTEGTAGNAGYFDFGSLAEFQLTGAGSMGEQAGPGALLNLTVRSGGDRVRGEAYYDYEGDATVSDNVPPALRIPGGTSGGFKAPTSRDPLTGTPTGLTAGNPVVRQYDLDALVGGPLAPGRAWFFLAYRDQNQYKRILGLPGAEAQSQLKNYTAKLTWQLTPGNQLVYFFNQRSKFQPERSLSLATPLESAHWQDSRNRPQKLEWTSVLGSRLFLDVQASHWGNFFPLFPTQTESASTEGVPVGRRELTTNQRSGATDYYHDRTTLKPQVSGRLSYFREGWGGTHHLKFGVEAYRERRKHQRFQPGNLYYRDREGVPVEVDIYNTPNEAINDATHTSLYAQDSWRMSRRLTINGGLRLERYVLGWPSQRAEPEQAAFFAPVSTRRTTVADLISLAPRAGVVWDLTGGGTTVAKGFYGRFAFNPSTEISERENPVGQAAIRFEMHDLNGNRLLDGPQELGRRLQTLGGAGFVRVDRDLAHAYGQELSGHLEHEAAVGLSIRGSYVYKNLRDGWAEVDVGRVGAYIVPVTVPDPGPDNALGTGDDRSLELRDRPADVPPDRVFTNPGRLPGVPEHAADYHTVEIAVQRRFRGRWMLLGSFAHTWATDFRDTGIPASVLEVARQAPAFLWQPNRRRFGRQDATFWSGKIVGRYVLPRDLGLSGSYRFQSGDNWARTIAVSLPGAGTETVHAEPLAANRGETVHLLDLRADKALPFPRRYGRVTLMLDVFNALNANPATNFRVITGSRFKEVIALLDPRIVRFGIRYEFPAAAIPVPES